MTVAVVFALVIAPLERFLICPVDIIRAAYWALLCMLDKVLKTALAAIKPNAISRSGVDATANSTATDPVRQSARPPAERRPRRGDLDGEHPGRQLAKAHVSQTERNGIVSIKGTFCVIINPIPD